MSKKTFNRNYSGNFNSNCDSNEYVESNQSNDCSYGIGNALVGNTRNFVARYTRKAKFSNGFDPRYVLRTRNGLGHFYTEQGIFAVSEDANNEIENPHQDGANLRRYFEHKNVLEFAKIDRVNGGNLRRIVDVGASRRLRNEPAITNYIALNPHCSIGDYLREAKTIEESGARRVYDETLESALQETRDGIQGLVKPRLIAPNDLLLFTDSLYYVNIESLGELLAEQDFGVVACGACHIPKKREDTDGFLRMGNYVFGYAGRQVDKSGEYMVMKVNGNPEHYSHNIILEDLLTSDTAVISLYEDKEKKNGVDKSNVIIAQALDRFDFGATVYTRFVLLKVKPHELNLEEESAKMRYIDSLTLWKPSQALSKQFSVDISRNLTIEKVGKHSVVKVKEDDLTISSQEAKIAIVGGDEMCYKVINGEIVALKVDKIVPERDDIVDKIAHISDDLKARFASYTLGGRKADFVFPMDTYNKIVKDLSKADAINLKTLKSAVFLAQLNVPHLDMQQYLLPVVESALKEAFGLEARLSSMLNSKEAVLLNKVKVGEDVQSHNSLFRRIARYCLSVQDEDFQ